MECLIVEKQNVWKEQAAPDDDKHQTTEHGRRQKTPDDAMKLTTEPLTSSCVFCIQYLHLLSEWQIVRTPEVYGRCPST